MRFTFSVALLLAMAATAAPLHAQTGASQPDLKWGPAPATLPAGAEMAVLHGDPGGPGVFTLRLRFPDGYRIAPHTHPADEYVTVISGVLRLGMGPKVVTKDMMALSAGGFVTAAANHPHYVIARGATVVQVHAVGPFVLTYVNAADIPPANRER